MKKSFPLDLSDQPLPRVVDSIKFEIRKYLKRERRKPLPDGVDFWDFDCRVGATREAAGVVHVETLLKAIDTASAEAWGSIYIEILAKPAKRIRKKKE